jgi:hypothetical protein
VVEVIPRDRASSIRVIAISGSSRYGELVSVNVLLNFLAIRKMTEILPVGKEFGSYGSIRLCIVGWRHALGKTQSHRLRVEQIGLMGSQSTIINCEERTLTTLGCDKDPDPEF